MSTDRDILRVFHTRAQTRAYYDRLSAAYDILAERSEAPLRRKGLKKLGLAPGARVVEIGCGTGHSVVECAQAVGGAGSVIGIDLSPGMLAQTRKALLAAEATAHLVCGDAGQLPLASGAADAVFMSFTLELFDTPEIPRVLAESRRVLQPGGRLGVVGMSKDGGPDFLVHAYEWTHLHFPNFVDCRPIHVSQAVEEAGFQVVSRDIEHIWLPVEIVVGVKGS